MSEKLTVDNILDEIWDVVGHGRVTGDIVIKGRNMSVWDISRSHCSYSVLILSFGSVHLVCALCDAVSSHRRVECAIGA